MSKIDEGDPNRKELSSEVSACVCATENDNIVFELYRQSVLS